jgi:hypothetical protein
MRKLMLAALILVATSAYAQLPLNLQSLDKLEAKATSKTRMDFDESMVKSATGALSGQKVDEAVVKKVTEGLKGFFLRAYEFDKEKYSLDELKPVRDQLKGPDWVSMIQSSEGDEIVEIWIHRTKGEADGMLLIAAESNELVVMYAIGVKDVSQLTNIGETLGNINIK